MRFHRRPRQRKALHRAVFELTTQPTCTPVSTWRPMTWHLSKQQAMLTLRPVTMHLLTIRTVFPIQGNLLFFIFFACDNFQLLSGVFSLIAARIDFFVDSFLHKAKLAYACYINILGSMSPFTIWRVRLYLRYSFLHPGYIS